MRPLHWTSALAVSSVRYKDASVVLSSFYSEHVSSLSIDSYNPHLAQPMARLDSKEEVDDKYVLPRNEAERERFGSLPDFPVLSV